MQVDVTGGKAYTLTEAMSREPVGCAVNMKEDKEMAARRIITVVESVAEKLLTLAYMLCIVEVYTLSRTVEQLGHVAVTIAYSYQNRKFYPAPPSEVPWSMSVGTLHSCHTQGHHSTFLSLPMDTDYILHKSIRRFASWAVYSFFTEVRVIGGENVPANGPIIVYVFHPRLRSYRRCD